LRKICLLPSADLADEANSGVKPFDSGRYCNDFLDYLSTDERGDDSGSRSGEENIVSVRGQSVAIFQPA
jgi:hypothetical protein